MAENSEGKKGLDKSEIVVKKERFEELLKKEQMFDEMCKSDRSRWGNAKEKEIEWQYFWESKKREKVKVIMWKFVEKEKVCGQRYTGG